MQALERAGLVVQRRDGQARPIALRLDALRGLDDWLEPFRAFRTASLAHLESHAKEVADADHDDAPIR